MRKNEKITALYERLSRDDFGKDDDQQRESNSISNQKAMSTVPTTASVFLNIPVHSTPKFLAERSARPSTVSTKMWYCPLSLKCS